MDPNQTAPVLIRLLLKQSDLGPYNIQMYNIGIQSVQVDGRRKRFYAKRFF